MHFLDSIVDSVNGLVWGPLMLVLILGTGLFLMLRLRFMPLAKIAAGFRLAWGNRAKGDADTGEISPFQALMTSLAATVGTGNIAGVATAIFLGGPGALFWMWVTALVGMATKYSEVLLAVHFRERDARGEFTGGPMYAIRNGLGPGGVAGHVVRAVWRPGRLRHRQHGAGQQHGRRAGYVLRHS